MKKALLREYLLERESKKVGEAFQPVIEKVVESKKFAKPRRVKKGE
jgi:hypothetical protein